MVMYRYYCSECGYSYEGNYKISERDCEVGMACVECGSSGTILRGVGNDGGFRLLGNCWSKDGYAKTLGDAEAYGRR